MSMNVLLDLTHATVMPHAQTLMEVMTVTVSKGSQEMASIVQVSFFLFEILFPPFAVYWWVEHTHFVVITSQFYIQVL